MQAARAQGSALRYRATVTPTSITVGTVVVPLDGPFGTLDGTDTQFAFTTSRYLSQPLVIRGPGAGAEVTAAGVYGDLLRAASAGRTIELHQ